MAMADGIGCADRRCQLTDRVGREFGIQSSSRGGKFEYLVRETGQLMVLAMDRQDPCSPASGIVHSLEQVVSGRRVRRDDQNCLIT
jgi:hypothetical protein